MRPATASCMITSTTSIGISNRERLESFKKRVSADANLDMMVRGEVVESAEVVGNNNAPGHLDVTRVSLNA